MKSVNIYDAKTRFFRLVAEAAAGTGDRSCGSRVYWTPRYRPMYWLASRTADAMLARYSELAVLVE